MFSDIIVTFEKNPFDDESKNLESLSDTFFEFTKNDNNSLDRCYKFSLKRKDGYFNVKIETVEVSEDDPKSDVIEQHIYEIKASLDEKFKIPFCVLASEIDVTTFACRFKENAIANFITDMVRCELGVDIILYQGGSIRADRVYPEGYVFRFSDMCSLFPNTDPFFIHEATGSDIKILLEQGYQSLPAAKGNFLHLSGAQITVDTSREPMDRVDADRIYVEGVKLDMNKVYRIAAPSFISEGKDGFTHFTKVKCTGIEEKSIIVLDMIVKFFETLNETISKMEESTSNNIAHHIPLKKDLGSGVYEDSIVYKADQDISLHYLAVKKMAIEKMAKFSKCVFVVDVARIDDGDLLVLNFELDRRLNLL